MQFFICAHHQGLVYLTGKQMLPMRHIYWAQFLFNFNTIAQHRPGKGFVAADALSNKKSNLILVNTTGGKELTAMLIPKEKLDKAPRRRSGRTDPLKSRGSCFCGPYL